MDQRPSLCPTRQVGKWFNNSASRWTHGNFGKSSLTTWHFIAVYGSGLLLAWDSPHTAHNVLKNYFLNTHMHLWVCFLRIRYHQDTEEKLQICWTQCMWSASFNSVQLYTKVIKSINKISELILWSSFSLNTYHESIIHSLLLFSIFWPHATHFLHSRQRNHLKI